jgi:hypothetical protein
MLVKQLFGKKALFFHPDIEQTIFKKIDCGSKQFVKHLTARIKKFVWHFTSNKSAKIYTNCRHFIYCFCYINACYQIVKKKSQKAWKFPANTIACTNMQTQSRHNTDNWFIGLDGISFLSPPVLSLEIRQIPTLSIKLQITLRF